MRIDKFVSKSLNVSRKDARDIIKKRRIKIGDKIAIKNDFEVKEEKVYLDDREIIYKEYHYIMLNKPKGYVSATIDNLHKTVFDLIKGYEKAELFMVGRLDIDTVGLLLLTNDGVLAHKLTSPNYECEKTYYVEVDKDFEEADIEKFREGMELIDGNNNKYITKESKLEILDTNKAYITIKEGKYHQVKRMCLNVGKTVTLLKRVRMGSLCLDPSLKEGEYRELEEEELNLLQESVK